MPVYRRFGLGQSIVHVMGVDVQLPRFLTAAVARLLDDDFFVDIETSDDERRNCIAEGSDWHARVTDRRTSQDPGGEVPMNELEFGGLVLPKGTCIHVHNLKDGMKIQKRDQTSIRAFGFSINLDVDWKITFTALKPRSINDVVCEAGAPCHREEEEWLMSLNALHEGTNVLTINGPGFSFSDTKQVSQTDELKFRVTPHQITPLPQGATESGGILRMPSQLAVDTGTQIQSGVTEKAHNCRVEIDTALVDGAVDPAIYEGGLLKIKIDARITGPTGAVDDVVENAAVPIDANGAPQLGPLMRVSGKAMKACNDIYWVNIQLTVHLLDAAGNDPTGQPLQRVFGGEFECPKPNPDRERDIIVQLAGLHAQLYFRIRLTSTCA